jgi:hypothetical protein
MKPISQHKAHLRVLESIEAILGSNFFRRDIKEMELQVKEINKQRGILVERSTASQKEWDALKHARNETLYFLGL